MYYTMNFIHFTWMAWRTKIKMYKNDITIVKMTKKYIDNKGEFWAKQQ